MGKPRKLKAHKLTKEEFELIARPAIGQGGMQSLLRKLQASVHKDELAVDEETFEKMKRYVEEYGSGGFQGRLRGLVEAIAAENAL